MSVSVSASDESSRMGYPPAADMQRAMPDAAQHGGIEPTGTVDPSGGGGNITATSAVAAASGASRLMRHTSLMRDKSLSFNQHLSALPTAIPEKADDAAATMTVANCVPVFEVGYWMNYGNFSAVRSQHERYKDHVRTLSVWNLPVESAYGADVAACLQLGWPQATHVSLEYSTWEPEPNKYSIAWHRILCESSAFPRLTDYRVWQMLPARLEVFSVHKFRTAQDRNQATDIIAQVPELLAPSAGVQQFYEHRCRYLEHVVMSMDSMNKAETYTKYKYLTLALATPVLAPRTLTIVNCRLKHVRAILNCIDRNALGLPTEALQYQPGRLELGQGLQHLHLKMTSLYDELTGLPISAARFPGLASLIIEHSPALDNSLADGEKFGQLWETRWAALKRLQLPFLSDQHAALVVKFMPALEILSVVPAAGFEGGAEYPDQLGASTVVKLATQMAQLRHMEVRSALRLRGKRPFNMADQVSQALRRPPMTPRPDVKLFAVPLVHMDLVSVVRLLTWLPGVEQLEFQLPDMHAQAATAGRAPGEPAHNLEGVAWAEEHARFAQAFAQTPHALQAVVVTGYHPDLHSAAVTDFLRLFPDLESLAFTGVAREDHANIDQLAGVLTALNPDLDVAIV